MGMIYEWISLWIIQDTQGYMEDILMVLEPNISKTAYGVVVLSSVSWWLMNMERLIWKKMCRCSGGRITVRIDFHYCRWPSVQAGPVISTYAKDPLYRLAYPGRDQIFILQMSLMLDSFKLCGDAVHTKGALYCYLNLICVDTCVQWCMQGLRVSFQYDNCTSSIVLF